MKNRYVFDIECFPNYFLFRALSIDTNEVNDKVIDSEDGYFSHIDVKRLYNLIEQPTIGFNTIKYDLPIICLLYTSPSPRD